MVSGWMIRGSRIAGGSGAAHRQTVDPEGERDDRGDRMSGSV